MNDRKRQVLLTAQRLFVEKGFSATSVQDILDESGISKGTFYNYFSTKNECLMAILEHARDEGVVKRRELLIGQDITDKSILAKQISIRMQVNRKHNLMPIFHAIFHSTDVDLRTFIKEYHVAELSWLAERLVDVYGEDAGPYAFDCSVMMHGIMQHMVQVFTASSKEEMDTLKLINFAMRRIDSIMSDMINTKDVLIGNRIFTNLFDHLEGHKQTKQQLLEQLTGFLKALEEDSRQRGSQYVQFLIDEMNSEEPRVLLMETVVRSFREAFVGTSHEPESRELASKVWRYMDMLEKEQ